MPPLGDIVEAINRAEIRAGRNDSEWNMRFRVALIREGLRLVQYTDWKLDRDAVVAPLPVTGAGAWSMPSYIVPRRHEKQP
jgi:hypothetical protein